jgi:hypothetical protein
LVEKRTRELDDKLIEIMQSEEQEKKNRRKLTETKNRACGTPS